jgi:hypothetical protein
VKQGTVAEDERRHNSGELRGEEQLPWWSSMDVGQDLGKAEPRKTQFENGLSLEGSYIAVKAYLRFKEFFSSLTACPSSDVAPNKAIKTICVTATTKHPSPETGRPKILP